MSTIYDAAEADLDAHLQENRLPTSTAYRISRPANTVAAYQVKKKAWYAFCDTSYALSPADRRYTVTAEKLHAWLRDDLMCREKKSGPKGADGSRGKLGYASLYAFVAGAVDLWNEQKAKGINSNPHPAPRDGHVRELLKVQGRNEAQRRREDVVDRGQGITLEAFSSEDLLRCNAWCLQHSGASKTLIRDRLALNLSVSCALRGHSIRNAELADFHHFSLPNEGPQSAHAVCIIVDIDKTIKYGQKHLMGAMRARDVRLCTQNSLAMYFFYRWHMSAEPFPDLSTPESWYSVKLIITRTAASRNYTQAMSYTSHLEAIDNIFQNNDIDSKGKTRIEGRSAAQMAELQKVSKMQTRRTGTWDMSDMESRYLDHLPRNLMRVAAGFDQAGGQYFLDRALVDPPEGLAAQVFPWIDRYQTNMPPDLAAGGFLALLKYLRVVLLQDMAVLWKDVPEHIFFKHAPFKTDAFRAFAETVSAGREIAEEPAEARLRHLVPDLAARLDNLQTTSNQSTNSILAQLQTNNEAVATTNSLLAQLQTHNEALATTNFLLAQLLERQNIQTTVLCDAMNGAANQLTRQSTRLSFAMNGGHQEAEFSLSRAGNFAPEVPFSSHAGHAAPVAIVEQPAFSLSRSISTVAELWQEWQNGINGRPSVQEMDSRHGASWRSTACERKFYSNRKVIISEIQTLIQGQAINPETAVDALDRRRGGKSLDYLMKSIKADRWGREREEEDRPGATAERSPKRRRRR